jgi:hypothetical protein
MQTVEAIIDTMGNVKVLSDIRLPNDRKALVTILDEEPVETGSKRLQERKEKLIEAFKKAQEANIFREIDDPVEWQRKLRDEWD